MAMPQMVNTSLPTSASMDLGLGADLKQQMKDQDEMRKKKLLAGNSTTDPTSPMNAASMLGMYK